MQTPVISIADTPDAIAQCFAVMVQLRPHLDKKTFIEQVVRQQQQGYQLAYLQHQDNIKAVAGFRYSESLFHGKFMYVDDLVTDESQRSLGYGKAIFSWLVEQAKTNNCRFLDLDSGVQRFAAHRFYLNNRMSISSHHFSLEL